MSSQRMIARQLRSAFGRPTTASWIASFSSATRQHQPHRAFATSLHANSSSSSSASKVAVVRGNCVEVLFPDGNSTSSYHHIWLRDHCREPRSYHAETKQRLIDTAKIHVDLLPSAVGSTKDGITVTWPAEEDGPSYTSFYPFSFLLQHSYSPPVSSLSSSASPLSLKTHWTSKIGSEPPTVEYEQVMGSEQGVWEWVKRIDEYGFCFVSGLPSTPEATEALVRRIAFIRETHYGGFWDFTADLSHGDLAYSDMELRGHTDTTYFSDPCGLQLFHLLSPSSSHKGGHNLLIDGFRAAALLQQSHPHLYDLFSTLPIPSHASGTGSSSSPSGVHMKPLLPSPVFTHHPVDKQLVQVRWNADDRAPLGGKEWEGKMETWYEAVRVWEGILRSEEAALWTVMQTGTAIIFDNHRVLHGRSAFVGERRLCGAYIAGDDYRSRLEGLRKQFDGGNQRKMKLGKEEKKSVWSDYL